MEFVAMRPDMARKCILAYLIYVLVNGHKLLTITFVKELSGNGSSHLVVKTVTGHMGLASILD